jgi:hypothetical protein
VRSRQPDKVIGGQTRRHARKKPTALVDYVIWGDNVMTLFIVAGDLLLWCLFECGEIKHIVYQENNILRTVADVAALPFVHVA